MRANRINVAGLLLAGCLAIGPVAALAQDPGTGSNQGFGRRGGFMRGQRGQRGPGGQFGQFGRGGGNFGPGGMMGRGMFGMMGGQEDKNPLVSHIYQLVQRPDVQSEINMDLRQKNALAQYQGQIPGVIRQQMQQQMQGLRQGGQGAQQGQDPQAQREQMRAQRQQQMQQAQSQIQNTINQGLTDILKPEQMARLAQLDLQWRGVLSIADPAVGEQVQATPEHRSAVNGLLTEYQNKTRESRQQLFEKMRADRQAAANAGQTGNLGGGGIRQDPTIALERADAAARKEAEDKALKVLSADEKDLWAKIQGRPFTFRTDIKTPQR